MCTNRREQSHHEAQVDFDCKNSQGRREIKVLLMGLFLVIHTDQMFVTCKRTRTRSHMTAWNIYLPLLSEIEAKPPCRLILIVAFQSSLFPFMRLRRKYRFACIRQPRSSSFMCSHHCHSAFAGGGSRPPAEHVPEMHEWMSS